MDVQNLSRFTIQGVGQPVDVLVGKYQFRTMPVPAGLKKELLSVSGFPATAPKFLGVGDQFQACLRQIWRAVVVAVYSSSFRIITTATAFPLSISFLLMTSSPSLPFLVLI